MSELGPQVSPAVPAQATLLIPLGATEQHGPHLPLDTDTQIAVAIAAGAASSPLVECVVAPALPYGSSGEHDGFAGTLSIGADALRVVLVELVRSAGLTFDRVVFVNGHGGNHPTLVSAVEQMVAEGHNVQAWWPSVAGGDAHAGRTETSLMLAIEPQLVQLGAAAAGNTTALGELLPAMIEGGVRSVSPNGVLGDPAGASADEGAALLADLVDDLIRLLSTPSPATLQR